MTTTTTRAADDHLDEAERCADRAVALSRDAVAAHRAGELDVAIDRLCCADEAAHDAYDAADLAADHGPEVEAMGWAEARRAFAAVVAARAALDALTVS